jgi:hypothetical protein
MGKIFAYALGNGRSQAGFKTKTTRGAGLPAASRLNRRVCPDSCCDGPAPRGDGQSRAGHRAGSAHCGAMQRELDEGSRLKITGTPANFVNGPSLSGVEAFVRVIEEELGRPAVPPSGKEYFHAPAERPSQVQYGLGGRLSSWCTKDTAGGGPGAMLTPRQKGGPP